MLPDKQAFAQCDVLFVMDFNSDGSAFGSMMNYVNAAIAQGLRVALFQWRNYNAHTKEPLNPAIRQMAQEAKLRVVAPGEKVTASTVIVGSPIILQHAVDLCPEVQSSNFVVIVDELMGIPEGRYDPEVARENLRELFGTEGTWVPVSEYVRRRMLADSRYPSPSPETWIPLIDTATWCVRPLSWRGGERQMPVVGCHGLDDDTKWPFFVKPEVRILGGASNSRDVFCDLDFFIHCPSKDLPGTFDRSVIEAMAAGCPVLLLPVCESTFGTAAVYCEPDSVWECIQPLWGNQREYLARAQAGRNFVLANCDWTQFAHRRDKLYR